MRVIRVLTALAVAGLLAGALAASGTGSSSGGAAAELVLSPANGTGVHGVGLFRQQGRRLSGWVAVWGLAPRTAHAVHVHGPGRCGRKAPAVAAHADLVADEDGVAFARFRMVSPAGVVGRRYYYNVHALPATAAENPEIACGNLARLR